MVEVIRYCNVRFYLLLKDERERRWFSFLKGRIMSGERMIMKNIYGWCASQGIRYRIRFCYRPDFPVMANLWNFYFYLRGRLTWGAKEGRLRMFSTEELAALDCSFFSIICADAYDVTIISKNTGHVWYIHNPEYPEPGGCIIFHKHRASHSYHRHGWGACGRR